jgi:GNAT superfamily N-acetyltransferase
MIEFTARYDPQRDRVWSVLRGNEIVASITIDSSADTHGAAHLRWFMITIDSSADNHGAAHLRWFIAAASVRGSGLGRHLLGEALDFCARRAFKQVYLTTFRGLDRARHLYEEFGFELVDTRRGTSWGNPVWEQRFEKVLTPLGEHSD